MAQAADVGVRPEPVTRVALRNIHVVRTIRTFLVTRWWRSDLTGLYDVCLSSLIQVVYPRPEGLERAAATLHELRRGENQLRRAERQALPAPGSARVPGESLCQAERRVSIPIGAPEHASTTAKSSTA